MSDTTAKRLKVSREGVVLIKSFEGFRASAQPRPDGGGWVIGYGHTRSAREGLTVSEADAELLLQYDLIPVVSTLNDQAPDWVNQHQFDALASYAFSIGLDRFEASPVLERLRAGAADEAADAMVGSPEIAPPDAVLRRRAAERALFVASADSPVTLAQLMAAPLPLPVPTTAEVEAEPEAVEQIAEPEAEPVAVEAEPVVDEAEPKPEAESTNEAAPTVEPDVAVVEAEPVEAEVVTPVDEASPEPQPVADLEPQAVVDGLEPVDEPTPETDDAPVEIEIAEHETTVNVTEEPGFEPAMAEIEVAAVPEAAVEDALQPSEDDAAIETPPVESEPEIIVEAPAPAPEPTPAPSPAPMAASAAASLRMSPYAGVLVGPIPGLNAAMSVVTPSPAASLPAAETPPEATTPVVVEEPSIESAAETFEASEHAPVLEAPGLTSAPVELPAPVVVEEAVADLAPATFVGEQNTEPVEAPDLVLTPLEEGEGPIIRPLWSDAERGAPQPAGSPLFEDVLQPAAATVLRHEAEAPARKTDWPEFGAFAAMGGIGLVSFGAAVAGFRKAGEGGVEAPQLAMVGWVLLLIALICVGVSGYNLFRTWMSDRKAN